MYGQKRLNFILVFGTFSLVLIVILMVDRQFDRRSRWAIVTLLKFREIAPQNLRLRRGFDPMIGPQIGGLPIAIWFCGRLCKLAL